MLEKLLPEWLRRADRHLLAGGVIALAVIFFLALNLASGILLQSARIDLTEDRLYTISDGTREVLTSIDEPVELRLYYSSELDDLGPYFSSHAARVERLLQDYAEISGGMLRVLRFDQRPFSPEEDMAVAARISGMPLGAGGEQTYFGLAGTNSTDDFEVIPYLAPERATFLEYDLTRLVSDLARPEKTVVALIGDAPMQGSQMDGFRRWAVLDSMEKFFEVRALYGEISAIDADVDILILAQPASLDERALYAVDQFVMRGGRLLAFVDPFAEVMQQGGLGAPPPPSAVTALAPLLEAWGVEIPADRIVGDRTHALRVQANERGREVIVDYLPWMTLDERGIARDDVVTGELKRISLRSPGFIRAREDAEVTIEPLLVSSDQAMEIAVERVSMMPDPSALLRDFAPAGEPFVLAARVSGPAVSAWPDGPPEAVEDEELHAAHRSEAEAPLSLVLVADIDMLADSSWMQNQRLLGQTFAVPVANNADLAVNALDNLSGSEGLIGLRGRGLTPRPFEVLEAMRREAEAQFLAKEQTLLDAIDETQEKIRSLKADEQEGGVLLTAEQQQAIEDFRAEMLELRHELRGVRRVLREGVESLEGRVRFANIWAVPLVVGLAGIGLALARRSRAARYRSERA
jgi:ABC-type uncharacterized transport system involved in gliding motility auxiliary subunit